ncbi:hypothetical protein BDZ91DRAFT_699390 [Kalaharituber pfeilii]|nr:hypothetical protein BDZ91DRAFT_699390 [Kalaharituber pfeilii]
MCGDNCSSSGTASSPAEQDVLTIPDAHCHPTDTPASLPAIPDMRQTSHLTVMSTRSSDFPHVYSLASSSPHKLVPSFGWHPWFSHLLFDDSDPSLIEIWREGEETAHYRKVLRPSPPEEGIVEGLGMPKGLGEAVEEVRAFVERWRREVGTGTGVVLGEVGVDRSFRLPWPKGYRGSGSEDGGGDGKEKALSPYKVSVEHQLAVLRKQFALAGELGLPTSVHGVQAHGALFELFRDLWRGWEVRDLVTDRERDNAHKGPPPFPPRICLHSFSAPPQTLGQYISQPSPSTIYPSTVYYSFSTTINSRNRERTEEVLRMVPRNRVLVESDLHEAGEEMERVLVGAVEEVARVKGWKAEEARRVVRRNWRGWIFGEEQGEGEEEGEEEERRVVKG